MYEDLDIENPNPSAVRFNPNLILDEIQEFPMVLMRAYERYAELKGTEDEKKEELKIMDADIADRMRKEAAEKGARITETQIASDVLLDNSHIQAVNDYHSARLAAGKYGAFLEGLQCKMSMIGVYKEMAKKSLSAASSFQDQKDADDREKSWTL